MNAVLTAHLLLTPLLRLRTSVHRGRSGDENACELIMSHFPE
jgi:hypothetical protein